MEKILFPSLLKLLLKPLLLLLTQLTPLIFHGCGLFLSVLFRAFSAQPALRSFEIYIRAIPLVTHVFIFHHIHEFVHVKVPPFTYTTAKAFLPVFFRGHS